MWWKNMEEEYNDILPLETKKLWKTSKFTRPIVPTTCSERWATIAYLKGMHAMEDEVYAAAFAYYISLVMTGMGMSATSEYVYFKESLEDVIFDALSSVKRMTMLKETWQKKKLWNTIFAIFYQEDTAQAHEKTIKCGTLHIPVRMKTALKEKGTIHEAIVSLMSENDFTQEKRVIVPSDEKVQVTLQLTYSEQKEFNRIPGDSPTQKVLWLLS